MVRILLADYPTLRLWLSNLLTGVKGDTRSSQTLPHNGIFWGELHRSLIYNIHNIFTSSLLSSYLIALICLDNRQKLPKNL